MSRLQRRNALKAEDVVEAPAEETGSVLEPPLAEMKTAPDLPAMENVRPKKTFNDRDGIKCRSITPGFMSMHGMKSHADYRWEDAGVETYVEYQDLAAAAHTRSVYLYGPHIVVEDEDFLENFPEIIKMYDNMYSVKDLKQILKLPVGKMRTEIEKLPDGAKKSVLSFASNAVESGELDSISRIKALNEIFGTNLLLLADISD